MEVASNRVSRVDNTGKFYRFTLFLKGKRQEITAGMISGYAFLCNDNIMNTYLLRAEKHSKSCSL